MGQLVVIGNVHDLGARSDFVGDARRNPCLEYVDYLEQAHPGELSDHDAHDMRTTYRNADSGTQLECLAMMHDRQRADRGRGRGNR